MKWKGYLTASEISFIVLGLENYGFFHKLARSICAALELPAKDGAYTLSDFENRIIELDRQQDEVAALVIKYKEAVDINQGLLSEIVVADDYERGDSSIESILKIVSRVEHPMFSDFDPTNTTVTRESAARWFLDWGDLGKAKLLVPNIESIPAHTNTTNQSGAKGRNQKTINTYLKIISALSKALINGLTGIKNTDAEAVLSVLDEKGIERPVDKKTLAKYLEEEKEL